MKMTKDIVEVDVEKMKIRVEVYYALLKDYRAGKLSETAWMEFCSQMLGSLMEEHKEVFIRLADR